jgi:hypothetical protein
MIVREFSRYLTTVESLLILEETPLVVTADFITDSFRPGSLPIASVKIIGHADVDAQRGRAFEQSVSETRAQAWIGTSARAWIG